MPLFLATDECEFTHSGGGGGGGGQVAAAAAGVVAVDDNWQQKRPATRAPTVAFLRAMTKADDGQQGNNQPMMGESKTGVGGGGNGDSEGSSGGGSG